MHAVACRRMVVALFQKQSEAAIVLHGGDTKLRFAAVRDFKFNFQAKMFAVPVARSSPIPDGNRYVIEFHHRPNLPRGIIDGMHCRLPARYTSEFVLYSRGIESVT